MGADVQQDTVCWVIRLDPTLPGQTDVEWLAEPGRGIVKSADEANMFVVRGEAVRVANYLRQLHGHNPVVCQYRKVAGVE